MLPLVLCLLAVGVDAFTVTPAAFIKLNDSRTDDLTGSPNFGNGAASASAFDENTRFLYVIGTVGDVMNVINMADPDNPQVIRKIVFNDITEGFPDAISICTLGTRRYLAVSFEKVGTSVRAFVRIYRPLEDAIDDLSVLYDNVVLDGYDPTSMAWGQECGVLVVVQQGRVHKINNVFDDPRPYIDIIVPGASSVSRTPVPIDPADLLAANVRHVLRECEDDATKTSTSIEDLEPRTVKVDSTNVAYIAFPKNNAVARMNLSPTGGQNYQLEFMNVGAKDWRPTTIDGARDSTIGPQNYRINTFYQPYDISLFTHNAETYIATADAGEFMSLSAAEDGCQFSESLSGQEWIASQQFGGGISVEDRNALAVDLADNARLGQMRFTQVKDPSDYYDGTTQGYNQVTGYGGRGMSILRPSVQTRVYDSGDLMESVFTQPDFPDAYKAVFNAEYGGANSVPSSRMDYLSPTTGPTPRAIVAGEIGGTEVIVVATGNVGGFYYFTLDRNGPEPLAIFEGYFRRGNPGLDWAALYAIDDDSVGEPETKDIQWIDLGSPTEAMIAVLGNQAGVVSFYRISLN